MAKIEDYDIDRDLDHPDISDRVEAIFNDYDFETLLEMNDLTPEDVFTLLYNAGQIREPETYLP